MKVSILVKIVSEDKNGQPLEVIIKERGIDPDKCLAVLELAKNKIEALS